MTGRPLGQAYSSKIAELGGDDWFFGRVAGGAKMAHIALEVGCSREWLYTWLKQAPGRRERFKEAQRDAAPLVHEDAGEIPAALEKLPKEELTPARVQVAKLRYDHEMSRARILDPETFGEKAGISVNIDIGQLHLDALRAKGSMTLQAKPAEPLALPPAQDNDE